MRDIIDLVEKMNPFASWKRWWANGASGKILEVPAGVEHDDFLYENLAQFLTGQEMKELGINARRPASSKIDPISACYSKGWQAMLYDGSDRSLMARTDDALPPRALRKIVDTIAGTVQVDELIVDRVTRVGDDDEDVVSARLQGDVLERFLKTGSIPRGLFR